MLEDNKNEVQKVDSSVETLPSVDNLIKKLDEVKTNDDIKDLTTIFNVSIAKNEMIRALKQDELLNLILKQASERLEKRPDELSTKDLLDYMSIFQSNLDRASGVVEKVNTQPTIQINQHKDVIINVGGLNRESKENVLDYIKSILKDANSQDISDMAQSLKTVEGDSTNND